ncbi:hypothetical protein [Arcobacter sp. CECT 9188]|uniref:hypothetical protein n=1 Tax=Arcobacter sp. CECT 9188 TaxID=2044505 RepID=UPI000DE81D46|nr:hypothetical protein [Arcobacter sp. CECT 9188]RBQ27472.1 hypothetical protein CRU88_02030 [Arcobacter sp. CECT 9188]
MKKNLSIIASFLLSAPLLADNLEDAFKNLKISGEIKTAYVNSNFLGATKSDDIFAIGGNLGIVTDSFYGFKAGVTFQASHIFTDDIKNINNDRVTNFYNSGAIMSESYLEYSLYNTSLKVGRQFIQTPLLSSGLEGKSSETIIKDSFEAYLLTNSDIPTTTIIAGYINKYQGSDSSSKDIANFKKLEDGAYTAYLKNESIDDLTIQAQYFNLNGIKSNEDKNATYFQADYKLGDHTLSAQYLNSYNKVQADKKGQLFGAKASGPLGIWKLGYLVAYNSSTDGEVYLGEGQGVTDTPFTSMPVHGGGVPTREDTNTIVGAIVIPILDANLIPYAGKSFSNKNALGDVTAVGTMFIYPVYKNILFKAEVEHVEIEKKILPKDNTNTYRAYLSYKF